MAETTAEDRALEELKKVRADTVKNNEEKIAFDAKQRPTPTPDELLAAAAGRNADEKEPSGAIPQDPNDPPHSFLDPHKRKNTTKKASAEGHDASYQTRAAQPQTKEQHK